MQGSGPADQIPHFRNISSDGRSAAKRGNANLGYHCDGNGDGPLFLKGVLSAFTFFLRSAPSDRSAVLPIGIGGDIRGV